MMASWCFCVGCRSGMLKGVAAVLVATLALASILSAYEPDPTAEQKVHEQSDIDQQAAEANRLYRSGDFTAAANLAAKVRDRQRQLSGDDSEAVVDASRWLAGLQEFADRFADAEVSRQVVLDHLRRKYGEKDWRAIDARIALEGCQKEAKLSAEERAELRTTWVQSGEASRLRNKGDYLGAIQVLEHVDQTRSRLLGEDDPLRLATLSNLAVLYDQSGNPKRAELIHREILAARVRTLGDSHPDVANSYHNLGTCLSEQRQLEEAEAMLRTALQLREPGSSEAPAAFASTVDNLAVLCQRKGDFAEAEMLYLKALGIRELSVGKQHVDYALSLNNLGYFRQTRGDLKTAERFFREAAEIYKSARGPAHPDYALALDNLANVILDQGRVDVAEPLFRQSLDIRKSALGPRHRRTLESMNNHALAYSQMGDHDLARRLFQDVADACESEFGPDDRGVATALNNLAMEYLDLKEITQEDLERAEACIRRTIAIHRQIQGPNGVDVQTAFSNLGMVLHRLERDDESIAAYKESLRIVAAVFGENDERYARSLNNLAYVHESRDEYERAHDLATRSLTIFTNVLGPEHPDSAAALTNVAVLTALQGKTDEALSMARRAAVAKYHQLQRIGGIQSERQQLQSLADRRWDLDIIVSLSLAARTDAWSEMLRWKGTVTARQRMIRASRAVLSAAPGSEAVTLFRELEARTRDLAAAYVQTPSDKDRSGFRKRLESMSEEVERLQQKLSSVSQDFAVAKEVSARGSDEIRKALPEGTALLDYLEYSRRDLTPNVKEGGKSPRWIRSVIAVIARPDFPEPVMVDLGPLDRISLAIESWRDSLGVSRLPANHAEATVADEEFVAELAEHPERVVSRLVWDPLRVHLQQVKTILISPDGILGQVPWGALPGNGPHHYLLEEYAIAILPVPQTLPDLAAHPREAGINRSLLVVGGVDYNADPGLGKSDGDSDTARSAPRGTGRGWTALKESREEASQVESLFRAAFPDGRVDALNGPEASEESLRRLAPSHRTLHLATHGYFAPSDFVAAGRADANRQTTATRQDRRAISGLHPGLLSGLVLAGANRPVKQGSDDGIMSALEVAELDLSGVDLSVLSACQTSLGQSAGGEGLLGLQRAFQVAGCRTVVSSLWNVDDAATRALMVDLYGKLWDGTRCSPVEALRRAQIRLMRREIGEDLKIDPAWPADASGRLPPRYWAAFLLSGDWR